MATEVGIGLIGAGRIGASHARLIAERVPGARLVAVADPRPGAAAVLTDELGGTPYEDPTPLVHDPRRRRRGDRRRLRGARRAGGAGRGGRQAGLLREADGDGPGRGGSGDLGRGPGRRGPAGRFQPTLRPGIPGGPPSGRRGRARRHPAAPLADPRSGAGRPGRRTTVDDLHPDADPRLRRAQLAEPGGRAGRGVRDGRCADRSRVRGGGSAGHRRGA